MENKPKKASRNIKPVREINKKPTEVKNPNLNSIFKNPEDSSAVQKKEQKNVELAGIKRENITNNLPSSDTQTCSIVPKKKPYSAKKSKKKRKNGGSVWSSLLKALVYMIGVFLVAAVLGYYIIMIGNDVFAFVKSTEVVEITVPENATLDDIVKLYDENGIVKYPKMFKLYANYKKDDGKFEAGTYQISPSMNYDNLLLALKYKVDYSTVRITIPEGYTVDEIIDLFVSNGISTREAFVEAINNYDFDLDFVKELDETISSDRYYRLEGYLFPDTYEFYQSSSAERVIYKMLLNFESKYSEKLAARAEELGYTQDQIITLASMIEKETKNANEFEYVSSVFHNRLNNPTSYPYLDSDATIVYAIHHDTGERPKELTNTDYDSPYNTYKNRGLPPGPIANPGYAAIMCALYPEKTNYYFFVAAENGSSIFSRTYAEHQSAVWKLRNSKQ